MDDIAKELGSKDEELRRLAVVGLAGRSLDESATLLHRAMADESWRVRKEAVAVLLCGAPHTAPLVEGLIELLRSHDNAGLRNAAVECLERLGTVAVQPLCRHLTDRDADLRKFVIDILGSIRSTASVPLLLRCLEDSDPNVRSGAVENLGKIGDPSALPRLLEALNEGDLWFKFTVLDALACIGVPVPLEAIAPLMRESLLRRAIYDCLGAVGGPDALPLLLEGVQERARSAREAAGCAVMRLRSRLAGVEREELDRKLKSLKGTHFLDGLLRSLGCADVSVLEPLVSLLGIVGDRRAALALLAVSRHERLRTTCVHAFRKMGPEVIPDLIAVFADAYPEERAFIAYLCGELGYSEGGALLIEGVRDESAALRIACLISLGKLQVPGAPRAIVDHLGDRDRAVAVAAREALELLGASAPAELAQICAELAASALPPRRRDAAFLLAGLHDAERLSLLAKDEEATVRSAAVASLARVGNPQIVGHLVLALVDEAPEVRVAAAGALGELGGEGALEPLLLALNDPDHGVQIAALKGLAVLGDRSALSGVMAHLAGARGFVLIAGLKTLAAVGGGEGLEPVMAALDDPDEEVVEAAIDILSQHGDGWIDAGRDKLLHHPHWGVRRAFVRVLGDKLGEAALPYLDIALARESDPLVKGEIQAVMGRFS